VASGGGSASSSTRAPRPIRFVDEEARTSGRAVNPRGEQQHCLRSRLLAVLRVMVMRAQRRFQRADVSDHAVAPRLGLASSPSTGAMKFGGSRRRQPAPRARPSNCTHGISRLRAMAIRTSTSRRWRCR
jgi:hypothetical protein